MNVEVLVNTLDMPREEWLKYRQQGIGGSDASAAAGISPWKSPMSLWLEKTGRIEPEAPGEEAYWGQVHEENVTREFEKRSGLEVRRLDAILQRPDKPFMLANIDREVIGQKIGLECKTTNAFRRSEWEDDNIPDDYYIQCQHYMAVTGYEAWWIACLIGGNYFVYKLIERNEELISQLIKTEEAFWQHVISDTMPPVDGTKASAEALKKLYPVSNGQIIDLPDTAEFWIKQYEQACEDEKEVKERKTEAQNALQSMLGETEAGQVNGRIVTWKNTKPVERFDNKEFQKFHPALYRQYLKIAEPQRRFNIKKIRG